MHKWANVCMFLKYNSKTDVLWLNFCRIFKKIGHKYSKGRCEGKMGRSRGLEIGLLSSVLYLLYIKRVERESFERVWSTVASSVPLMMWVRRAEYTHLNSIPVRKTPRKPLRLLTCVLWNWWGIGTQARSTSRKAWSERRAGLGLSWESKKRWSLLPFQGKRLHGYFLWASMGRGLAQSHLRGNGTKRASWKMDKDESQRKSVWNYRETRDWLEEALSA